MNLTKDEDEGFATYAGKFNRTFEKIKMDEVSPDRERRLISVKDLLSNEAEL